MARLRDYGAANSGRIVGLDVARGLAVLGMFGAHIGVPDVFDWATPTTWLSLVDGRSSILFATLAGVSIAILTGRTDTLDGDALVHARVRILVRAALIFAIGGLLEFLSVGIAVILPMYALLFVLSLPFLRWRSRRLFIAAGVVALVAPVLLLVHPEDFDLVSSAFTDLLAYGVYPGILWIAFLFVGLGIGRLQLSSLRVQLRLLVVGVVLATVAYSGGAFAESVFFEEVPDTAGRGEAAEVVPGSDVDISDTMCEVFGEGAYFCYLDGYYDDGREFDEDASGDFWSMIDFTTLASVQPHSGTPFEAFGSGGFAMAVIGLALIATRRRTIRWALYPLACVGAMALTAYAGHIIAILAVGDAAWAGQDNWLWLWFVVGALAFCTAWVTFIGRGPLEKLVTVVSRRTADPSPRSLTVTRQ